MAATAGRIVCGKCGANNFDTQASCWKCGVPLAAGVSAPRPAMPASVAPSPQAAPPMGYSLPVTPPPDPMVAAIAAICLAIFFPYIAVPVGIVFLMLDDRRKIEVGRLTLIAGIISTVLQMMITFWFLQASLRQGMALVQSMTGIHGAASGGDGEGDSALPSLYTRPKIQIDPSSISKPPPTDNVPFPEPPNLSGSSR